MKKKILSVLLTTAMVASMLVGCGSSQGAAESTSTSTDTQEAAPAEDTSSETTDAAADTAAGGGKVGVAMPTKDLQRWNQDGSNMEAQLKEAGYEVDLQYASNDIPTQVSQIENMINSGCELLVIASIDGDSLGFIFFQMHIDFMRAAVPLHHHPDMGFFPVKLDDFAVLAAAVRFCRTREI